MHVYNVKCTIQVKTISAIYLKGVFGFPGCPGEDLVLCEIMRRLLNLGAYLDPIQNILIQAQVG